MKLTARTMKTTLGQTGLLSVDGGKLAVFVEIIDAKEAWGQLRVSVIPVAGDQSLSSWVDASRVTLSTAPVTVSPIRPIIESAR